MEWKKITPEVIKGWKNTEKYVMAYSSVGDYFVMLTWDGENSFDSELGKYSIDHIILCFQYYFVLTRPKRTHMRPRR